MNYLPNQLIGVSLLSISYEPSMRSEIEEGQLVVKWRMPEIVRVAVCTNARGGFECWYRNPLTGKAQMMLNDLPKFFIPMKPFNLAEMIAIPETSPYILVDVIKRDGRQAELEEGFKVLMALSKSGEIMERTL